MRKLFKKSIACCLVLALSLCLFAGAISANALTTNPSYSTEAVTVAPGESTTIKFTVSDFSEIQGVILKVYVPAVVASINSVTADNFTMVEWDDEAGAGNYQIGSDATGKFVKFMELANFTGVDTVAGFTFDINVTVAADAAEGPATFPAPVIQATDGESLVTINGEFNEFTVEAAVVEPVLDPDLTLFNVSASVQDSLGIGYIIMNNKYNTKYARIEMEVVANKYNADRDLDVYTYTVPFTPLNGTSTTISNAVYSGIAMFEIDQTVTAKIKAYDAEDNYVAYSIDYVNDPVSLLKNLYTTSTNNLYKTMVTDMFNLGTAAQAYFGNVAAQTNPDNDLLANFNSNPINKDWDQTYASEGMPELTLANTTTWDASSPLAKSELTFLANMNLAATPSVGYLFKLNTTKYTLDDIRIEVSYDAVYPKSFAGTRTETFTAANFGTAATFKTAIFTKMTLTDSNREVTAKVYCADQLVLTSVYTMDQGIKTQAATAGAKDLATALGQFETAARNYFASV